LQARIERRLTVHLSRVMDSWVDWQARIEGVEEGFLVGDMAWLRLGIQTKVTMDYAHNFFPR
jgi:hypothetical protein